MIHIGDYNKLTILRDTEPGLFLGDDVDQEVLLPNRYVPEEFEIDDTIEVFVYLDNEERLVAVTDHPYIKKENSHSFVAITSLKLAHFLIGDW